MIIYRVAIQTDGISAFSISVLSELISHYNQFAQFLAMTQKIEIMDIACVVEAMALE